MELLSNLVSNPRTNTITNCTAPKKEHQQTLFAIDVTTLMKNKDPD